MGVGFKLFNVVVVFVEGVEDDFFRGVLVLKFCVFFCKDICGGFEFCFVIDVEGLDEFLEVVFSNVGDGVEGRRLEFFEVGVVEDFGYGVLYGCVVDFFCYDWVFVGEEVGFDILFDEGFGIVFLELVLVYLLLLVSY